MTLALGLAAPAQAAPVSQDMRFTTSDGVSLAVRVTGEAPLAPRPVIAEFSPYGATCCGQPGGPAYNHLQVQVRGTGDSSGRFDAFGDRIQRDLVEVLDWACGQPWSDGRLGLYGFSASAIAVYNALHRELPCVRTAVLGAGTHDLYRDLLHPGGIPNVGPGTGVFALIGAPLLASGPDRLARDPLSAIDAQQGMQDVGLAFLTHPTLDAWWKERRVRGEANDLPILMVTGFYDVESRGPFEAFRALREDGAHLLVIGAHDGVPAGTGGANPYERRWFDRHLRGLANGADAEPRVRLWLADGDREDLLEGRFVRAEGDDWPLPGTRWETLHADPDGSLARERGTDPAWQAYPALPSQPFATDPHTTSTLAGFGAGELSGNRLARELPQLTQMGGVERLGLAFTTAPFAQDVLSAGPAAVDLRLRSSAPETDLYVVLSDVHADGSAHPVATGRLRSAFPRINRRRSLRDPLTGAIVGPYGRYGRKVATRPGRARRYRVELWPVGNRFKAGHRLRLHVLGASAYHAPGAPAVNAVRVGGARGARLRLPVLPGSDLGAALP